MKLKYWKEKELTEKEKKYLVNEILPLSWLKNLKNKQLFMIRRDDDNNV